MTHIKYLFFLMFIILNPYVKAKDNFKNHQPDKYNNRFVMVHVAKQTQSVLSPWEKGSIYYRSHLAPYVENSVMKKKGILIAAQSISSATSILLQKFGSNEQIPLEVHFVDYEVNLAFLTPKKPYTLPKELKTLKLSKNIPLRSQVKIMTHWEKTRLEENSSEIYTANIFESSTSSYQFMHYQIKTLAKNLGYSEPILHKNELAGLVVHQNQSYARAIPVTILKHFLEDSLTKNYKGFPYTGIYTMNIESRTLRRYLQVPPHFDGLGIAYIERNSPFYNDISSKDLIISFDKKKITKKGHIQNKFLGKSSYMTYINSLYTGDALKITYLHKGKKHSITKKLKRYFSNNKLIVDYNYDHKYPHLIFSGLVFQELSRPYISLLKSQWSQLGRVNILHMWTYKNKEPPNKHERVIILSRILSDESNHGYQHLKAKIITHINNKEVKSLDDVKQSIKKPLIRSGGKYFLAQLEEGEGEIILSYNNIRKINQRIRRNYNITEKISFFP